MRTFIVYRHVIHREAFRRFLEAREGLTVVGAAGDGKRAFELMTRTRPDIVIADLWLPGFGAVNLTRRLKARRFTSRMIIMPTHGPHDQVADALRAGAYAYLTENSTPEELWVAIENVAADRCYLSPTVTRQVVGALEPGSEKPVAGLRLLSHQEKEVLRLVAEGLSTKEVATELGISTRTAETYRAALMAKLKVHKVVHLVRLAVREGLITA